MSIQAVAWALEQDLPARPKLVLVSIANHANHIDGYCWLKAETIAAEASCSRRGVFNFVGDLIRNGYVRKSLRRGEDGKQRANDYWIVLDRPDAPWIKSGQQDEDVTDAEIDAGEAELIEAEQDAAPRDVVDGVHGVHAADAVQNDDAEPVDKHARAPGPHAPACTHKDSAEPSESKPKATAREATLAAARRHYRPPPPQPVAADTEAKGNPIFVFEGTPAYQAWSVVMARQHGVRSWHLTTRKFVDGRWRSGWYWPTLFPPSQAPPPDRREGGLSEQDMNDFR